MRVDLLENLGEQKNLSHVIILTHNIDFLFLQYIIMKELRKCGHPSLTVFADAGCALPTFARQAPAIEGLGTRYRVVPIEMKTGLRFHPKAVLLAGKDRGTLLVGSGNLTFGGWQQNAEIWTRFDSDKDGGAPFSAFKNYLDQVVSLSVLPDAVQGEMETCFDPKSHPWAAELGTPDFLVGSPSAGAQSLLDQMVKITGAGVDELVIHAPFFDEWGRAVRQVISTLQPSRTRILVQDRSTTLTSQAASSLPDHVSIQGVDFFESSEPEKKSRYLHAKFYGVARGRDVTVFAGSANCSQAALTIPGRSGNAELVAVRRMTATEFQKQFLDELVLSEQAPVLHDPPESPEPEPGPGLIRVLAARMEGGRLEVGFRASGIKITRALVDEVWLTPVSSGEDSMLFDVGHPARAVVLEGETVAGEKIISLPCWVDDEVLLRKTSHTRALGEAIRKNVNPESWGMGAWSEILSLFSRHLRYAPVGNPLALPRRPKAEMPARTYSIHDVFSDQYHHQWSGEAGKYRDPSGRLVSLRSWLLRWFGVPIPDDPVEPPEAEPEGPYNSDGDGADSPPPPPPDPPRPAPTPVNKAHAIAGLKKACAKTIEEITGFMAGSEYLKARSPEYLADDIKMASALFRTGLAEQWITEDEFHCLSYRIWASWFLSSEQKPDKGGIEIYREQFSPPSEFAERIRSSELAAAMISWAMAVPPEIKNPEQARFQTACVVAIARFPWLWEGTSREEVDQELSRIFALTSNLDEHGLEKMGARFREMNERGAALAELEDILSPYPPSQLRTMIVGRVELNGGELVWQGSPSQGLHGWGLISGFKYPDRVRILFLEGEVQERLFQSDFIIPLRAILHLTNIFPVNFDQQKRNCLQRMITDFSNLS